MLLEGGDFLNDSREATTPIKNFRDAYLSSDYDNYFLEVEGDVKVNLEKLNYIFYYEPAKNAYIIAVEKGMFEALISELNGIINIETSFPYTLDSIQSIIGDNIKEFDVIQPVAAANITKLNSYGFLGLTGKDTVTAIIDTGIDYLNPQFWDSEGNTRIIGIWDQTINLEQVDEINVNLPYGTFYSRDQINLAIKAYKNGDDPYKIVPSKDTNGHGTRVAGLIGAKGLDGIWGGAPDCEFLIIKLVELKDNVLIQAGINQRTTEIYGGIDILSALAFCYKFKETSIKPLAVSLALGTNFGGHDGISSLERYIDIFAEKIGIAFITGTGNEGLSDTHASTMFEKEDEIKNINFSVGNGEENLVLSVWVKRPDIVSAGLVSPSGEIIEPIPAKIITKQKVKFLLENSIVEFNYSLHEISTGDEHILITISNPVEGIWQLRLRGDYIATGRVDIWLPQRTLLKPLTRFLDGDPNLTLQTPSTSDFIISTAYYNQNNNSFAAFSGRGFTRSGLVKPIIVTGGYSARTTGLNNKVDVVYGSSVGSAVLCGAVLLLLQWGIVLGNDETMQGKKIQSYITRGASKRPGDIYPNTEWGWGMLNMEGTFLNLRYYSGNITRNILVDKISTTLEIFIPDALYQRLHCRSKIKGD